MKLNNLITEKKNNTNSKDVLLNELSGKVLFPKKLALANEMLSKSKIPVLD